MARCAPAAAGEVDDVGEFLRSLAQLKTPERQVALRLLHVATIVDGRLTAKERQLLGEALRAAGQVVDLAPAERLRRAFVHGDAVDVELLRRIG